jgi:Ala-tRNA(Pro) deacylase
MNTFSRAYPPIQQKYAALWRAFFAASHYNSCAEESVDPEISQAELAVLEALKNLGIPFHRFTHPAVYTVEEADRYWGEIHAVHCKNLFLRNQKGDKHYLLVAISTKRIDLKALGNQINVPKPSFASEERLMRYLGLTTGAVSPFGLLNDREATVRLLLDDELKAAEEVAFHPNVNTATVTLRFSDFERFVTSTNHTIQFVKV